MKTPLWFSGALAVLCSVALYSKEPIFVLYKIDGPVHDPSANTFWYGPFSEASAVFDVNADGVLVAVEGETVLGFVTTRLDPDTGIGQIPNIAVDASAQGKGIGTALLHAALDHLRDHGMTHVRIETLENNPVGRHLYPKLGFQEIARQIHYMMEIPPPDDASTGDR